MDHMSRELYLYILEQYAEPIWMVIYFFGMTLGPVISVFFSIVFGLLGMSVGGTGFD